MADTIKTNLGPVTAYADAKAHGYTGTREEFGQLLANAGLNLKAAETAKTGAESAKTAADNSAKTAASSASAASGAASTATTQATAAKSSADNAASSATAAKSSETAAAKSAQGATNAETAAKAAQSAAETAKTGADTAASNAAANATAAANSAADAKNTADKLPEAINTALAQAKASGEFNGADGITPTIGENGNWYLGDTDTGKTSRGETGPQGHPGADGYTPVKGTDYFTESDKTELVNAVLAALPAAEGVSY